MDELKKWLELFKLYQAESIQSLLEEMVLAQKPLGDEFDFGDVNEAVQFLSIFASSLFEPYDAPADKKLVRYARIKPIAEIDKRDLILASFEGGAGVREPEMPGILQGEFLHLQELEPGTYVLVMRLAFDPSHLFDQLATIEERLHIYLNDAEQGK